MSFSNQYEYYRKIEEENKKQKEEIEKLIEERNYYIYVNCWSDLYKEYVGLYNTSEKSLVINHSYIELFYPYGDDRYITQYEDDDVECLAVKGSWDNWTKEYSIEKKRVTDSCGYYEGYVYYIVIDTEIVNGMEYQYKIKDDVEGGWIGPCIDEDIHDDIEEDIYLLDSTEQKMIRNEMGSWNATLVVRSV